MPNLENDDTTTAVKIGFPAINTIEEPEGQDRPGVLESADWIEKQKSTIENTSEDNIANKASWKSPSPFPDDENQRSMRGGGNQVGYRREMKDLAQQQVDKLDDIYTSMQQNNILLNLIFQSQGSLGNAQGGSSFGSSSGSDHGGGGGFGLGGILGAVAGFEGGKAMLGGAGRKGAAAAGKAATKGILGRLLIGGGELAAGLAGGAELMAGLAVGSTLYDVIRQQNENAINSPPDENTSVLDQARSQVLRKQRLDLSNGNMMGGLFQHGDNSQDALKQNIVTMEKLQDSISKLEESIKHLGNSTDSNTDETKKEIEFLQNELKKRQSDLALTEGATKKLLPDSESILQDQIKKSKEDAEKFGLTHGYVSPLSYLRNLRPGGGIGDGSEGPIGSGPFMRTQGGRSLGFGPVITQKISSQLRGNQKISYDTLVASGTDPEVAKLMVANASGESLANPANTHHDPSNSNPNQMAHGMISWDDARSQRIMKEFSNGVSPNDMSLVDQTKAYKWELQKYYPQVWATLNDKSQSGIQKMYALTHGYENSANPAGDASKRMGFVRDFSQTESNPTSGKGVLDHLEEMKKRGMITNEQCVALATAAVGIPLGANVKGGNVHDWRNMGDINKDVPAGTPIATFVDRQGQPSDRYAGGGSGTPGAHLDHGAVVTGNYKYDEKGNIIAAEVADQSAGHPFDSNNRPDGRPGATRWINRIGNKGYGGEDNLANYGIIGVDNDQGGLDPLGGANNPMWSKIHPTLADNSITTKRSSNLVANLTKESMSSLTNQNLSPIIQQFNSSHGTDPRVGNVTEINKNKKPDKTSPPDEYLKQLFVSQGHGGIGHA